MSMNTRFYISSHWAHCFQTKVEIGTQLGRALPFRLDNNKKTDYFWVYMVHFIAFQLKGISANLKVHIKCF